MGESVADLLAVGSSALATGDWAAARGAFEAVLAEEDLPDAHDGLARVLWWLEGPTQAVAERTHAYAGYRRAGDVRAAAHVALWLAHEYGVGLRNPAAAGGWTTRAAGLLERLAEGPDHARLALVRCERADDPFEAGQHAKAALAIARRLGDPDLEITALGRLGLAEVRVGAVESGMSRLDEAMAAALGGEAAELETLGELCCTLIAACDQTGDVDRLRQWNQLLGEATHDRGELPVMSFCGCCSAEALIARGRLDDAERELGRTLRLVEVGVTPPARCVDPRARLADLLVRQGRFEEAEQLLPGAEGDGWTVRARAELHLARAQPGAAAVVLERRLRQVGAESLLAVTVLDLLVQARLAAEDVAAAEAAAYSLEALASCGIDRVRAYADRARGRVLATKDPVAAVPPLERAAAVFARLGMDLEAGRTRLDLASGLRAVDRQAAIAEARSAHAALHTAGASFERDRAAALLRELGDESRPAPAQHVADLTGREVEVLRLIAEGLTNAEIAGRLFISTKTAGNHVSNILMKLGVRNRSQAAAVARTYLGM